MSCLLIKFSGCSPVSLPLSSPPSFARMLGNRRLCWGGDRIHIAEFQAPGFLSRGAQSSLSRLSSNFWLSWFSCACLCRSESIRLLRAAWAVAYPALLFPLSVFQPFSKSPIPSQTFFCSHHCKFTLKRFLCLYFTIVLAETLKGKGIHNKFNLPSFFGTLLAIKQANIRRSLAIQWLGFSTSTAKGLEFNPWLDI